MSLHDVSKHDNQRLDPKANASDARPQREAHGTNSVNYVTDASADSQSALRGGNAQLVQQGTVTVETPNGSTGVITTTTTTVAHNLGYSPLALGFMNNITGSGYGIPLPMWISFGNNTGGVGGASEYLGVIRYMSVAVDGTNFYVLTYSSGVAIAANYTITYYLYQQAAQ